MGEAVIDGLISEYLLTAEAAATVDYSNKKSVRRFNSLSDRMRAIVNEVVTLGQDAVVRFAVVLEKEPAAGWAAHHLVEMAHLDPIILSKCFERVEKTRAQAEAKGDVADAMGEEMWLREWRARKS